MNTPAPRNTQSGAAMLGIVLVIVVILLALVGALAIGPQIQKITNERQTVKRANVIVDAVKQYYLARGELPEPGSVPVTALNLEQKHRYDAWGQEWCYYRATIEDPNDPDDWITDITGLTVKRDNDDDGQRVAGVLISKGPNQVLESFLDGSGSAMTACPADGVDIDSITLGGEDIVIPLNVQGEGIQIAKDELNRLSSRKLCPKFDDDLGLTQPWDVEAQQYSLENDWSEFFLRTGLGMTHRDDPWMDNSNNQRYVWESRKVLTDPEHFGEGRWVSLGSDPEVQRMYGRTFECDYETGCEYDPGENGENGGVSEAALYLDFGGDIQGTTGSGSLTPGSHFQYNELEIQLGGPGDTFSGLDVTCPSPVPVSIKSTRCLLFNGTSDFLWVTDDEFFDPGHPDHGFDEFTLAAWMRPNAPLNNWAKLISRRSGSNFYFLGANNSSSSNVFPYGAVGDGTGWTKAPPEGSLLYSVVGDLNLNFDEWHHVAVTYNGSDLNFYYNGELTDTQPSSHDLIGLADRKLLIGADGPHSSPYHFFRGYMADPAMWKEALTDAQVKQVYNGDY